MSADGYRLIRAGGQGSTLYHVARESAGYPRCARGKLSVVTVVAARTTTLLVLAGMNTVPARALCPTCFTSDERVNFGRMIA